MIGNERRKGYWCGGDRIARKEKQMRGRLRVVIMALLGCLALGGLALVVSASSRSTIGLTGTVVPVGAVPTRDTVPTPPPLTATAVATVLAGHVAFDATEAANFAPGQSHRTADPRTASTPPASCPRGGAATPLILQDPKVEQHSIVIAIASQAQLMVGMESYLLSSGASRDNPQQGVIVVTHYVADPCAHPEQQTETRPYPAPSQHGAVRITGVQGALVTFSQADGTPGSFDVTTARYNVP